jgi:hypothetical protein
LDVYLRACLKLFELQMTIAVAIPSPRGWPSQSLGAVCADKPPLMAAVIVEPAGNSLYRFGPGIETSDDYRVMPDDNETVQKEE